MKTTPTLKRTPLYDTHIEQGGKVIPFAGWEMPIQYNSILGESKAVRTGAGIFDVSHMGRLDIRGHNATDLLNRVLSIDVPSMLIGRARYNVICNENGGIIDDCIVYRQKERQYLLIPNASNTATVIGWLNQWKKSSEQVQMEDLTSQVAMIALQGPKSPGILENFVSDDLSKLRPFRATPMEIDGSTAYVARTGYTGEDGFEIIIPAQTAGRVWTQLCVNGASPCGLGARDVLRLEAGLLLHGNDMDSSVNPFEAGLGMFVNVRKHDYIAGEALRRIKARGIKRKLVGLTIIGRGIPRRGYPILKNGEQIGQVSSGGLAPTLDSAIAMGYVPTCSSETGTLLQIDIRGRAAEAKITSLPFYTRRKSL